MRTRVALALLALPAPAAAQFGPPDPVPPRRGCPAAMADNAQIECLLGQMTLGEKALFVSGTGFATHGVPRLGIPPLRMSDGPKGVRTDGYPPTTAFPGGVSLASTWNPALVERAAAAMGEEAGALGISVLLGPGVNIQRYPLGGRNFEYYAEDPVLAGSIGAGWVRGVQSQGVAATPKHFAANSQETNRFWNDSRVDERTLREIYLAQFERIVREAGPWTIMSSYNRLNGTYASHDRWLLTDVLRHEWGFDGAVISDWTALHDTAAGINAGLDVEMPSTRYYGPLLADAVANKQVALATLDDSVRRILRLQLRTRALDRAKPVDTASPAIGSAAHLQLAREVAAESLVLLRNDRGLLPLKPGMRVALIGPNADPLTYQGAGSSEVTATRQPTLVAAVEAIVGAGHITAVRGADNDPAIPAARAAQFRTDASGGQSGLTLAYYASTDFTGTPLAVRHDRVLFGSGPENRDPDRALPARAVRWSGWLQADTAGDYLFNSVGAGLARLWVDDRLVLDEHSKQGSTAVFGQPVATREARVTLAAGPHRFRADRVLPDDPSLPRWLFRFGVKSPTGTIAQAVAAARAADAAVVVVGLSPTAESEGIDRADIELPGEQNALVEAVLAANPNTVVVLNAGGPLHLPWAAGATTLVEAWYPGQEGALALADALFGRVNPSGKLPVTFPLRLQDSPAYPFARNTRVAAYGEGVFVGYRGYDVRDMPVLFPFGHGLSYTRFAYDGLVVPASVPVGSDVAVRFTLANAGAVAGSETAQLYVAPLAPSEPRPPRELKGFRKLALAPGERKAVALRLTPRDFAFWDPADGGWRVEPGRYAIAAGSSSRDLRLIATVDLTGPALTIGADGGHRQEVAL